jgi:hypothetical protein
VHHPKVKRIQWNPTIGGADIIQVFDGSFNELAAESADCAKSRRYYNFLLSSLTLSNIHAIKSKRLGFRCLRNRKASFELEGRTTGVNFLELAEKIYIVSN